MPRATALTLVVAVATVAVAQDRPSPLETLLDEPTFTAPKPSAEREAGGMGGRPPTGGGGSPMGGGPPGYDLMWSPSRPLSGRAGELGLVRQGLNVGMPLWRGGSGDMLIGSVSVRNTLFQTDAVLPDSGRPFPDQLWNLSLSANYLHQFENGWSGMLIAGFGSASDRPFDSFREVTATLGGFLMIPAADGRDRWQVGAMYLYGGPVNFPLPILAYQWNPSERLRVNVGLPFSVNWRPTDEWEFTASYVPLLTISARLTYKFAPGWQTYGGYEFFNESYLLAGRTNTRDRYFGFEQRVVGGVRYDVGQFLTLELNGGYGFGRYYGEGESQWRPLRDRVDVGAGPFVGLRVGLRF